MIAFTRRSLALLPAVAPLLSPGLARAAELNPAAVTFKLPDQIKWSAPSPTARKMRCWSAIRPRKDSSA